MQRIILAAFFLLGGCQHNDSSCYVAVFGYKVVSVSELNCKPGYKAPR